MRQHRNAESGEGRVELCDQVRAAELRRDFLRDLRQVIKLRREQQFLDVTDEAMLGQVGAAYYLRARSR